MLKLFRYVKEKKEIILRLAIADIKTRYAGSFLGILWSLLEPLFLILVYSIVFPLILKANFKEWFLFFITGFIPFRYFRKSILEITTSLVDYSNILEKSRMDAETMILAKAISILISFLIELSIILFLVIPFVKPSIFYILLPIAIFTSFLTALGFGFIFSVMYPKARDISYILSIVFEALFFLTPSVYRIENIPSLYRGIYFLNPFARFVYFYQGIFLYNSPQFEKYFSLFEEAFLLFLFSAFVLIIGYKKFEKEKYESLEAI